MRQVLCGGRLCRYNLLSSIDVTQIAGIVFKKAIAFAYLNVLRFELKLVLLKEP
jgi:hypothetical protein